MADTVTARRGWGGFGSLRCGVCRGKVVKSIGVVPETGEVVTLHTRYCEVCDTVYLLVGYEAGFFTPALVDIVPAIVYRWVAEVEYPVKVSAVLQQWGFPPPWGSGVQPAWKCVNGHRPTFVGGADYPGMFQGVCHRCGLQYVRGRTAKENEAPVAAIDLGVKPKPMAQSTA